jgi:hypothetical protein
LLFQLAVLVRAGTAQLIGMMRASPFAKPGFDPHILSRRGGCSSTIFQVRHLADAACNVEVGVFTRGHTCKLGIIETLRANNDETSTPRKFTLEGDS